MKQTRRQFIATSAAAAGTITFLPFYANAGGHLPNEFKTDGGTITVHPISHASIVMETPKGTLYIDPVGDAAAYADFPDADFVLITHHHGDHFNQDTLNAVVKDKTVIMTNPKVGEDIADAMKAKNTVISNGESGEAMGIKIEAIPAYNLAEDKQKFHPKGRDNGYVLNFDNFRVYISGDTEDIPEMRALENIDLAFVCMNLPFTMPAEAAASAVKEFKPKFVYPYHYRGRDGGTQDPQKFAELVGDAAVVKLGDWYGG
ncbi:MBL fold metallo-hydrolase [Pseudahrensia aquimaris]|uniref:MBL fold metallo-hydrolase n=1 Tax=Pseudahrensia aquimaris TaxID=744461 RepID=A0ABW3FIA7_9HYPH